MKAFGALFNLYFIYYYFGLDGFGGGGDFKKCNYTWV